MAKNVTIDFLLNIAFTLASDLTCSATACVSCLAFSGSTPLTGATSASAAAAAAAAAGAGAGTAAG